MKNKTMLIIAIVAIIMIIICAILLHIISKYLNSDYLETDFEAQEMYEQQQEIKLLDNKNKYFVVKNILLSITSCIKEINGDMEYDTFEIEENQAMAAFLKEGLEIMNNMLDEQYKTSMNPTEESIVKIANRYNNYDYVIDKVYYCDKFVNMDIYIVEAYLGNEKLNVMIKTDTSNDTFSIFLEDYMKKYNYSNNMKIEDVNIQNTSVQKNQYNQFNYKNITDKAVANYYFENYTNIAKYQTKKAYELLEEEYKNKKFATYNQFENHIKQKENTVNLKGYKIIKGDDYTLYICKDNYNFIYIFKETFIGKYTVQLDDYTIPNKEITTSYEEMNELDKGANCVTKFFEMINMKDYNEAYQKLNNAFKNKKFAKEQDFQEYIKQKTFSINNINIESYSEEADKYIYNVTVTDALENSQEQYNYRIIVNLLEEADFEILFEI